MPWIHLPEDDETPDLERLTRHWRKNGGRTPHVVAVMKPSPKKCDVVSTFKVTRGSGQHWAHPVVANGRLYIRHGDALMAYDISAVSGDP